MPTNLVLLAVMVITNWATEYRSGPTRTIYATPTNVVCNITVQYDVGIGTNYLFTVQPVRGKKQWCDNRLSAEGIFVRESQ